LEAVFFDDDFFELLRLLELFFEELAFLLAPFFGIFAPDLRASLNPIAIACFGFLTFFLPPDFSSPCLYSCITFCIFFLTVRFDFGLDPDDERLLLLFFFVGIALPVHLRQTAKELFQRISITN
jgi:hypothetical protein